MPSRPAAASPLAGSWHRCKIARTLGAMTHPEMLKARVRGVLAFPITPFAADGSVDLDAVRANASWLPDAGIDAIVAPSGTGELFGLSPAECVDVTRATVD